jgi:hypothetical protein
MPILKKSSIYKGILDFWPPEMKGIFSKSTTPQKLGVNFRKFGKLTLGFQICGDASACLFPLFRRLEQKLSYLAGSNACTR